MARAPRRDEELRRRIEKHVLEFVRRQPAQPQDIARCLVGAPTARSAFEATGLFGALQAMNIDRKYVVDTIQRMIRKQLGVSIDRHLGVVPLPLRADVPEPQNAPVQEAQPRPYASALSSMLATTPAPSRSPRVATTPSGAAPTVFARTPAGSTAPTPHTGKVPSAPLSRSASSSAVVVRTPASTLDAALEISSTSSVVAPRALSLAAAASSFALHAPLMSSSAAQARPATTEPTVSAGGSLSDEQARVLQVICEGQSVFFSGAAGTGKSFLLRRAIEELKAKHGDHAVFVTAATGIAACNIGGTTLHSFAGVGLADKGAEETATRVCRNRQAVSRWKAAKCLVVDEISMVDSSLFEAVELVARRARRSSLPFGGVQLVLTGDFFQLPPVGMDSQKRGRSDKKYCFQSDRWRACIQQSVMLTTVFRQRDHQFVEVLNNLRQGIVDSRVTSLLKQAGSEVDREIARGCAPTRLFARNAEVDVLNSRQLDKLPGERVVFKAEDSGEEPFLKSLQTNCAALDEVALKKGAAVMLLKNIDVEAGLVNGSVGTVVDFVTPSIGIADASFPRTPKVEFRVKQGDGEERLLTRTVEPDSWTAELGGVPVASRRQIPLKLAWALSIHKSQGMTIPLVEVSLGGVFAKGQAYVALSRAVSLPCIKVHGFRPSDVVACSQVKEFYAAMPPASSLPPAPADTRKENSARASIERLCLDSDALMDQIAHSPPDHIKVARRAFKRPRPAPEAAATDQVSSPPVQAEDDDFQPPKRTITAHKASWFDGLDPQAFDWD
jgi:ATP-dependent DNA helicase PIF1